MCGERIYLFIYLYLLKRIEMKLGVVLIADFIADIFLFTYTSDLCNKRGSRRVKE